MTLEAFVAIGLSLMATAVWGGLIAYLRKAFAQLSAAQEGMKAILYDSIVQTYNKYRDEHGDASYLPIYARKTLDAVHSAYKTMGGNGTATSLYEKMMAWPIDKEERAPVRCTGLTKD